MNKRQILITAILIFGMSFGFVHAGSLIPSQLVTCNGPDCNMSSFAQLASNVLRFLIGITVTGSVIVIAWAGFKYMTARGNTSEINRAHDIFMHIAIGLVIVLVAWLVVSTLLKVLTGKDLNEQKQYIVE